MPTYIIDLHISGGASIIIEAEDKTKARQLAEEQINEFDFDAPLEEVECLDIINITELKPTET